jgi:cytidylate kinase
MYVLGGNLSKPATIAIDGSAASGKSTIGAQLAQRLGYLYFDTGVMYRAVTWATLDREINPEDVEAVSALAEKLRIEVKPNGPQDGRLYTVLADDQDITWLIRSPEVEAYVSLVSSYPRVRVALTTQQRRIAAQGSIVMVGRDIGTVVLPEAELKIFMHASAEERARRRYREILAQGKPADFEEILAAMRERDKQDREKPISPMVPAADAVIIETDNLSLEAVLTRLEQIIAAEQAVGQVENKR